MMDFKTLEEAGASAVYRADSRMQRARMLAFIGFVSVSAWFGVVAIARLTPSDPGSGAGLVLAALAALVFPAAAAAFCASTVLSTMALVTKPVLATPFNIVVTVATGVGTLVLVYLVIVIYS
jgi:hypothetical protein